jgi:hypothetical protein
MPRRRVWEVDIEIVGPITISTDISFRQEKGFDQDQFYSNVILHREKLKAMGWYAKGRISNNTLDAFLAYWNAIEIAGTQYHTTTERTSGGRN